LTSCEAQAEPRSQFRNLENKQNKKQLEKKIEFSLYENFYLSYTKRY